MPGLEFYFDVPEHFVFDEVKMAIVDGVVKLRPHIVGGTNYSSQGVHEQAVVTIPAVLLLGVTEFFSFEVSGELNGGAVEIRFSNDGGTTYRFWDGAAWAVAGATDFSSLLDAQENFGTFPQGASHLYAAQLRLSPSAENTTPELTRFVLMFETVFAFEEDLERSLVRYLRTAVAARALEEITLTQASLTVRLGSLLTPLTIRGVFNKTTDPGLLTNLFSSLDVGARIVTMSAQQPSGSVIRVDWDGTPDIVAGKDATYEGATLPVILVQIQSTAEYRAVRRGDDQVEINDALSVARERLQGVRSRSTVVVRCGASNVQECKKLIGAISKAMQLMRKFRSEAHGNFYRILEYDPFRLRGDVARNLVEYQARAVIDGIDWPTLDYREVPLMTTFGLTVGGEEA